MVQCFDRNHDHDNDQMEKLQESMITEPFLGKERLSLILVLLGCIFSARRCKHG